MATTTPRKYNLRKRKSKKGTSESDSESPKQNTRSTITKPRNSTVKQSKNPRKKASKSPNIKLPVYKKETIKKPQNTTKQKPPQDLYEFNEPDSENEANPNKKRKLNYNEDPEFEIEEAKKPTKAKPAPKKRARAVKKPRIMTITLPAPKTPPQPVKKPQNPAPKHVKFAQQPEKPPDIEVVDIGPPESPSSNSLLASPSKFNRPEANSTMLHSVLTPWRFNDLNIHRNPHFISLKASALPHVNQEMVIDHCMAQRFDESSRTPRPRAESPARVQKTLTDYFPRSGGKENAPAANMSLFGLDELSPIKLRSPDRASPARRPVLADLTNSSGESLFGFRSGASDGGGAEPARSKESRPFRLSVKPSDRKYQRKKPVRVQKALDSSEEEEESDGESEDGREGKIFDEFDGVERAVEDVVDIGEEIRMATKGAKRKGRKKARMNDVMTKEEEIAAEKWAEAFNSMCEEVSKFPLKIE